MQCNASDSAFRLPHPQADLALALDGRITNGLLISLLWSTRKQRDLVNVASQSLPDLFGSLKLNSPSVQSLIPRRFLLCPVLSSMSTTLTRDGNLPSPFQGKVADRTRCPGERCSDRRHDEGWEDEKDTGEENGGRHHHANKCQGEQCCKTEDGQGDEEGGEKEEKREGREEDLEGDESLQLFR
jgi:hypothetical protein